MSISFNEAKQFFHLCNGKISYIIAIERGRFVCHRYFGAALRNFTGNLGFPITGGAFSVNPFPEDRVFSPHTLLLETSTQGSGDYRVPNYQIRAASGTTVTDFRYQSYRIKKGKAALPDLPSLRGSETDVTTLELCLEDPYQHLQMTLVYNLYENAPIITRHVRFENQGDTTVYLENAGSAQLDLPVSDYELLTLYGSHAHEARLSRAKLHPGIQRIESTRGTSSPQYQPFLGLCAPDATEFSGEVIGLHFVYSGNFVAQVEKTQYGTSRVQMGIHPDTFDWQLSPGADFTTPEVVLNHSAAGFNGLSQNFHHIYQTHLIPERFATKKRPVLLNSWEGNYFDFTIDSLRTQIHKASELGIELFVLDDGWFGQRNDDHTSLGDWFVNKEKLPGGLEEVAATVHQSGMKFGLWFEPEMVSRESELYQNHPDWALQVAPYPSLESRSQLVLDLSQKEVQDYLIQSLSQHLEKGAIDYVKWDMNRHFSEVGNDCLPAAQQKEIPHRYVLGLYHVLDVLTKRFPDVLFENCSSGGGRFDPGMMYYMPQTWTSDNTDALNRSQIQYGYSFLYPPIMMGAHVSDVPNHQVGRVTPLETRGYLAMSGNFGYENNLKKLTAADQKVITEQIAFYKAHRDLFQFGHFYRLLPPTENFATAWLFVDDNEVFVVYFHGVAHPSAETVFLKLHYLDPEAFYKEVATKKSYSGSELNQIGLAVSGAHEDYHTTVFHLQKIKD